MTAFRFDPDRWLTAPGASALTAATFRKFVRVLALAAEYGQGGFLPAPQAVADALDLDLEDTNTLLDELYDRGLVAYDPIDGLYVEGWDRAQVTADAERKRRQRARGWDVAVTSLVTSHGHSPPPVTPDGTEVSPQTPLQERGRSSRPVLALAVQDLKALAVQGPKEPLQVPEGALLATAAPEKLTPSLLAALWNQVVPLSKVAEISAKRRAKMIQRIREHPDPKFWLKVCEQVAGSAFLSGGGARGWKATIDWIIANDTNAVRVFEGVFGDTQPRERRRQLEDMAR